MKLTKNNLLLDIQPMPNGNGNRVRTLIDPQSNEMVSQDEIGAPTLRSKAVKRQRRG